MVNIIIFGTFDLIHIGHINMLNQCKKYGDKMIVGVSSDDLNYKKKKDIQYLNKRIELKL